MNKKIIIGSALLGFAATFWACGSGEIFTMTDDDKLELSEDILVDQSLVQDSTKCPGCWNRGGTSQSSSSVSKRSSTSRPQLSSVAYSSIEGISVNLQSSSSYDWTPQSSAGHHGPGPVPVSSSSQEIIVKPGNDVGSCAPDPSLATVNVGEKTTWKFTRGSAVATTDLIKATFTWNFEGGTPSTATATGASGLSQSVSYAASGSHGATVTVTLGASSYPVTCSPVQVNGAAITGCKCSTSATSVDYTATPDVAWAVTGCTTGAGLTLSYEWDGAPGTEAYIKTFTAPHAGYTPKLRVMNNDNTVIEVKNCPAVKLTDGPEYQITTTQKAGAIDLPKGSSNVVVSVQNEGYVFCQIDREKANSTTGTFRGTVNKTTLSGNDYKEIQLPGGIPVGSTLEFNIDVPLTCGVR